MSDDRKIKHQEVLAGERTAVGIEWLREIGKDRIFVDLSKDCSRFLVEHAPLPDELVLWYTVDGARHNTVFRLVPEDSSMVLHER